MLKEDYAIVTFSKNTKFYHCIPEMSDNIKKGRIFLSMSYFWNYLPVKIYECRLKKEIKCLLMIDMITDYGHIYGCGHKIIKEYIDTSYDGYEIAMKNDNYRNGFTLLKNLLIDEFDGWYSSLDGGNLMEVCLFIKNNELDDLLLYKEITRAQANIIENTNDFENFLINKPTMTKLGPKIISDNLNRLIDRESPELDNKGTDEFIKIYIRSNKY